MGGIIVLRMSWTAIAVIACFSCLQVEAGWPFSSNGGPPRGTEEWYAMHAGNPVGDRPVYKYGKVWPPYPRPSGPKQLFIHKYYTQKYWPLPYVCEDRQTVRGVWESQAENGWQMMTTLYEYHFDPATHALNVSGQQHLRWILTSAPPERRHITVQASLDPTVNQLRVSNVQLAAANAGGATAASDITLRTTPAAGRPAEEVNWIYEQQQQLRTPPQIQYSAAQ